jgi:hypothetical protein
MTARLGNALVLGLCGVTALAVALAGLLAILPDTDAPPWILIFLVAAVLGVILGRAILHLFAEP